MLTKNFQQLETEVGRHVAADSVAQNSYETCFIGCLANHSNDPHFIETTYGIPVMVSRIAESIFEDLPAEDATAFFAALPEAVECDGKDLSRVSWAFLAAELRSLPTVPGDVQAVIDPVITGLDLLAEGKEWKDAQAVAEAADAARVAAYAAGRVKGYAAAIATAKLAAVAAVAAAENATGNAAVAAVASANAVNNAVDAAVDAAVDVADVRRRQRDLLLKLIKEAPVAVEGDQ